MGRRPPAVRDDDHRRADDRLDRRGERRRDPHPDGRGADLRARGRAPARPDRGPLPGDDPGRVHPHLRHPRLRRAAVLRRPAGAAAVRQEPGLAAGLAPGVGDRAGPGGDGDAHPDRRPGDHGRLERGVGRVPAPDPARGDARPAGHGRLHPARAGQRRPGARRRLRRGRPRPRRARATRRLASRLPQCARARDHGHGPAGRAAARRRGAHRADVQLARARQSRCSNTSTTATTSAFRAWSRCSHW